MATLYGTAGNDNLIGVWNEQNSFFGGFGHDTLWGGQEHDFMRGGAGDDVFQAGAGNDYMRGGIGDDTFYGDDGADILRGGVGDDYLMGGAGNDLLVGGPGDDVMSGGLGDDVFLFGTRIGSVIVREGFDGGGVDGGDCLDLRLSDADLGVGGRQAWRLDEGDAWGMGEIRQVQDGSHRRLEFQNDGDAEADFVIIIENYGANLGVDDFLFS